MSVIYMHLKYEDFKELERQMKEFRETTHKTTGGFYHKSLRVKVGDNLTLEFHGPLVGGFGHDTALIATESAKGPPARPADLFAPINGVLGGVTSG